MDYATAADVLPHDLARVAADFAARFQALEQQLVSFQPVARALIALLAKSPAALPNSDLHAVYATPSLLPSSDDYASLAVQTNHASAAYSRRPSVLLQMPNTMKSLALNTEVSLEDIREEWVKDAKTASVLDVAMAAADANDSDPQDASGFSIRGGSSGGGGFELESARSMSKFHLARSAFAIKFPTSTSELHNFRSSDNDISGKKSAEVLPRHKMPKRIKELKLSSSGSIGLPDPESPANVVEDGAEETNQKSVVSVSKQLLHTLSRKASQKSVAEIKQQKQHSVSQIAASKQKSKLQKIFDQGLRENSNIVINADLAFSVIYTTELWLIPVSICFKFDLTVYYSILVSLQNLADCTFEFITLRSSHPAMCAESTIQDWREHYVRNRLAVDIIAIIPFELIPVANSEYFWLLKLLKMYKLVRIVEYSPVYVRIRNDFLKATKIGHAGSLMFPVLFWFCLFLHFQSCVIFLVASLFGFVNEESAPYRDAPIWDQYIWALFTSTANFFPLGYHPKNYQEQLVTLFFVICSAGLFACIVGVISSIAVGFDPSGRMYKQKTDELIEYMRWKQLDNRMQEKVLNYFKLKYRGKYFQESSLLNEMNESLRMEIAAHNCRELISKVPFLRREQHDGRDDLFSGRIACALEPCYFVAGDVLFVQGEVGHDMYFILSGSVLVIVGGKGVAVLRDGSFFGEIALIANIPRTATVRATSNSMIYRLTREAFMSITEVFDDVRVHVDQLFKERMDKIKMDEELKKMSVMQGVLAKLPFLGCVDEGLEDAFCAKLVDLLVSVFFVGGDIITSEGEYQESSKMYILKSGSVDIRVKGQTTEVISSGGYFGEFALITKSPWKSTAQATSACMCYTIERTAFHAFLQEFPKTKEQLLGSGRGLINGES